MVKERQICVKQILDNFARGIYKGLGYMGILIVLIGLALFFLYPHYHEYEYMKECRQEGHAQEWCEQTWQELRAMD